MCACDNPGDIVPPSAWDDNCKSIVVSSPDCCYVYEAKLAPCMAAVRSLLPELPRASRLLLSLFVGTAIELISHTGIVLARLPCKHQRRHGTRLLQKYRICTQSLRGKAAATKSFRASLHSCLATKQRLRERMGSRRHPWQHSKSVLNPARRSSAIGKQMCSEKRLVQMPLLQITQGSRHGPSSTSTCKLVFAAANLRATRLQSSTLHADMLLAL